MGRGRSKRTRRKSPAVRQQTNQPVKTHPQGNNAENGCKQSNPPATQQEKPTLSIKNTETDSSNKEHKWWADPKIILAIAEFALAAILTVATVGLWIKAGDQIQVARDAIAEAQKANIISRDTLETSQRAWMTFDGLDIRGEPTEVGPFEYQVAWRNSGVSPAFNVKTAISFKFIALEDSIPPIQPPPEGALEPAFPVGADHVVHTNRVFVGPDGVDMLLNRQMRLIVYSVIEYDDIFSGDTRRQSIFVAEIKYGLNAGSGSTEAPLISYDAIGDHSTVK